jgi:hypothetical protein
MRRSRWADPEETEEKRDEPVTLTESQYRALKRGAMLGTLGLVLGLVGTGLAVWSLARSPGNEANPTVAQAAMAPESAPAPDTVAAAPMPSPSLLPSPTPVIPKAAVAARKTTARRAAPPDVTQEKPVTQPASSVLEETPTPPAPAPVQVEPVKPEGGTGSGK